MNNSQLLGEGGDQCDRGRSSPLPSDVPSAALELSTVLHLILRGSTLLNAGIVTAEAAQNDPVLFLT